jgi:hypothetical protein
MSTIAEARIAMNEGLDKGTTCPCCERYIKRYRRKLNAGMAIFLVQLYRLSGDQSPWVHALDVYRLNNRRLQGDYGKLRFWQLIELHPNNDPNKTSSGMYRLTAKGRDFVEKRCEVPAHAFVLNNECEKFSDQMISIEGALGTKFDLLDLLSETKAAA